MNTRAAMKHNRRGVLRLAGAVAATVVLGGLPFAIHAASAANEKMKIGIVGSGKVGGTLGGVWVKAGHEVMFSSLSLEQDNALAASLGPNVRAGTPRQAAAFGDDANAIAVASRLVREVGYEPVVIGPLAAGKHLMPGTPLVGEQTPEQIRKVAATLNRADPAGGASAPGFRGAASGRKSGHRAVTV